MIYEEILTCEAGVYTETADAIGISFTTAELFHGSIADCLHMLSHYGAHARARLYIETVDGLIHLDPAEIEAALARQGD